VVREPRLPDKLLISMKLRTLSLITLITASLSGCTGNNSSNWTSDFNQGSLALQQKNFSKAEELRKQCINETNGDATKELLSLGALARVYRTAGKADQSIEVSKNAIRKAIAYGDQNSLLLAHFMMVPLTRYYEKLGREAEIPKLKEELKLPELSPSPIADKQQQYVTELTEQAQKNFGSERVPGKKTILVLILTPEATERALVVTESSGDAIWDKKALDAVHACQPYPAFPEKPEHDVTAIIAFGTEGAAQPLPAPDNAAKATEPPAKLPSPDEVPSLPEHMTFPILPDQKAHNKK